MLTEDNWYKLSVFQHELEPMQRIQVIEAVNTALEKTTDAEREQLFADSGLSNIARACYKAEKLGISWR